MKRGSAGRYFTVAGGMRMAMRRCISNVSAMCLGLALETDLHRTTVAQWEINLRAALVATARHYHAAQIDALRIQRKEYTDAVSQGLPVNAGVTISMTCMRGGPSSMHDGNLQVRATLLR